MITLHPVLNRRMLGVALLAQFGIASIVVGQSPRVPSASRDPHDRGGMGASIFVLDSAALAELHARTLTEALTATLPGVSVMQSSGRVGDGPRVRIRGESGFLSVLQPILYVDGVRVNAEQVSSRLDDIDLNDVERLEVLPGAAAAALYGTNTTAGVIRVTTRRGRAGPTRWTLTGETGLTEDATTYPANYGYSGTSNLCTRADVTTGRCLPTPIQSYNPLESASPFRVAKSGRIAARISGGLEKMTYAASGSVREEQGVLRSNSQARQTASLHVDLRPSRRFEARLNGTYAGGSTDVPEYNSPYSILGAGLMGNSRDDDVLHGYSDFPVNLLEQVHANERLDHALLSARIGGQVTRWLSWSATHGRDRTGQTSLSGDPLAILLGSAATPMAKATRLTSDLTTFFTTTNAEVVASVGESSRLSVFAAIGYDGVKIVSDSNARRSANGGSAESHVHQTMEMSGLYARSRITWKGARSLGVGFRQERTAPFGVGQKDLLPAADLLWVVSDEPFYSDSPRAGSLRLRAAYGEVGDDRSLDPFAIWVFSPLTGATTAAEPRLERTREIEGGVDAGILHDRILLSATIYQKRTTNGYVGIAQSPFGGIAYNNGRWETKGAEASISARVLDRAAFRWDTKVGVSALENKITDIDGLPPRRGVLTTNAPGYPIRSMLVGGYIVSDANHDGVIVKAEVTEDPTTVTYASSIPTREISVTNVLGFGQHIVIGALLDGRGGYKQLNLTEAERCAATVCAAVIDPSATIADQGRAATMRNDIVSGYAAFAEDGDFMRLRELWLTWTVPSSLMRHVSARALRVSAIGRNLAIWTRYSGLDPEVTTDVLGTRAQVDYQTLPIPRSFSIRLEVTP